MKKTLLALTFLACPSFAHAQEQFQSMPDNTIDAAVDKFAPTTCGNDPDKTIQAVYDCYHDIGTQKKNAICVLADTHLMTIITSVQDEARDLGRAIPYTNMPFLTEERYNKNVNQFIITYYLKNNYTHKRLEDAKEIFLKDYFKFSKKIAHKCAKMNPSLFK